MSDTNQQLLSELKETFKMFDVDGDGVISVQELKLVMKKFGYNMSEEDLEKLIKQLDKDGNGTIELQQYLDVMMKNSMERSQILDQNSELMATFRLFDVNQDGLISAEQLKQGLEILGNKGEPITEQDIKELLDAADIDGDGYINYEQFVRMLKFK